MASPAPAPALSFPPQTFQKLSPTSYLLRHLQSTPPTRPSGRNPNAFREPTVHTNSLSHAHGSAVVRMGDTAVVCGVRGEILSLTNGEGKTKGKIVVLRSSEDNDGDLMNEEEDGGEGELRARNLVVTNLELGTGCSRDYHPGPPSDFAQSTTSRLHRLLLSTTSLISPTSLRITDSHLTEPETKAYWVLYIDVLCISLDGNILDTAWASIIAALRSTRLPRAYWDADLEAVVCDPSPAQYSRLQLGPLAFTASFAVVSGVTDEGRIVILSDPDEFEESVCEESVMVCIKEGGKIARIEKGGGLACGMEGLGECVTRARDRFDVWEKLVRNAIV